MSTENEPIVQQSIPGTCVGANPIQVLVQISTTSISLRDSINRMAPISIVSQASTNGHSIFTN